MRGTCPNSKNGIHEPSIQGNPRSKMTYYVCNNCGKKEERGEGTFYTEQQETISELDQLRAALSESQAKCEKLEKELAAWEAQPPYGCFVDGMFFEGSSKDKWGCDVVEVYCKPSDTQDHLNALLAEAEKRGMENAIPEGWKLVPIKPTEEMIDAPFDLPSDSLDAPEIIYEAMLAAAPSPENESS